MWLSLTLDGETYQYVPAHKLKWELPSKARPWMTNIRGTNAARQAHRELNEQLKKYGAAALDDLWQRVMFECWCAHQYDQSTDRPHQILTKILRQSSKTRAAAVKQTKALREYLEKAAQRNPIDIDVPVGNAFQRVFGSIPGEVQSGNFVNLLEELESQFGGRLSPIRITIGCLDYGKIVKGHNLPDDEAQTSLEFALVLRFKHFTGAKGRDPVEIADCAMPSDGEARYKLVALISKATFGEKSYVNPQTWIDDAKKTEARLTKLRHDYPDIRYVGWPVRA